MNVEQPAPVFNADDADVPADFDPAVHPINGPHWYGISPGDPDPVAAVVDLLRPDDDRAAA